MLKGEWVHQAKAAVASGSVMEGIAVHQHGGLSASQKGMCGFSVREDGQYGW